MSINSHASKPSKATEVHKPRHLLKLKMAEHHKFWQRRESRNMKVATARNQKLASGSNILEAMAQLGGGDAAEGPRQMKIVVKKEDLKQLLEAIKDGRIRRGPPPTSAAAALEHRLNFLRRRQILRGAGQVKGRSRSGSWRPVLQSIPEEV